MRLSFLVVFIITIITAFTTAEARSNGGSHPVKGHVKKDGTYVQPHHATNPNSTQKDNYSSKPNVNPYTGKEGTKEAQK